LRATKAIIDLAALRKNYAAAKQRAGGAKVMAVVKANAYGHGLERVGNALANADAFGVATLSDAHRLRSAGLSQRIVLLSGFDEAADLPELRALGVDTVVHHEYQLRHLEQSSGEPIRVWLKIDSGMHRLGIPQDQAAAAYERLSAAQSVAPDIVLMTHLASADEPSPAQTPAQQQKFEQVVSSLAGARSVGNSPAVLNQTATNADWIRVGGLLYGLSTKPNTVGSNYGLTPVMTLQSKLIAINAVAAGERIGYGGSYCCQRDTRVGIAAIGYGDGYPRHAQSGTPVLVGQLQCPTVGRVSMDLLAIDLSQAPAAEVGDPVTLWGPELPAETIAECAETIAYELTCGVTRRVLFVEREG